MLVFFKLRYLQMNKIIVKYLREKQKENHHGNIFKYHTSHTNNYTSNSVSSSIIQEHEKEIQKTTGLIY